MIQVSLPYGQQQVSESDVQAVARALGSRLITQGPTVEHFESAVAEYLGARYAVAYSSGTAALHAAAFAAGLGPGDEALVSPITFVASANCVLYQGARPRFVDIDPRTWNLDTSAAAAAADQRTRAAVPVSFAGLPVDLEPFAAVRDQVVVIEDACHALGATRSDEKVGGAGGADITTFSLHPVKAITTGEGGLATTEDDELAARLRAFRTHGITRDGPREPTDGDWLYDVGSLGFNYRITDFQCALGLSQLGRLDEFVDRRNQIAQCYRDLLAGLEGIQLPPDAPPGSVHAYHLFVIRVLAGPEARLAVFSGLRAAGIGVQVHYIPVYRFTHYREHLGYPQGEWPAAEDYYATAISLPIFPAMTDADIELVVKELRRLLA